uniref:Uncharacterized protein n=1 Tax=Canis lupus dingo TaxID=286419 RepID=A0A8C0JK70_CANLU
MCPGSFLRQVRVRSQDLDPRRPPSAGLPFLSLPCRCRRKAGGGRAGPGLLGARRGLPDVQLGGGQGGPRRRAVPPVLAGPEVGVAVGAARPPGPVGLRSPRALRPRRAYREQECPRYEANNRGVHVRCRFDDVSRLQRHIQFWVNGTSRRSGIPCSDLCVELPEIERLSPPHITATCNKSYSMMEWKVLSHFNHRFLYELQIQKGTDPASTEKVSVPRVPRTGHPEAQVCFPYCAASPPCRTPRGPHAPTPRSPGVGAEGKQLGREVLSSRGSSSVTASPPLSRIRTPVVGLRASSSGRSSS